MISKKISNYFYFIAKSRMEAGEATMVRAEAENERHPSGVGQHRVKVEIENGKK